MQSSNSKTRSNPKKTRQRCQTLSSGFPAKGVRHFHPVFFIFCFVVLLFFVSGCASTIHLKKTRPHAEEEGKIITVEDTEIAPAAKSLRVGEKLTYRVAWIGIPVGTVTSEVKEIAKIKGRDTYHVELVVKTNMFCSAIYRIDDRFETFMDTQTLLPLRHELKRREGRHKKDYIVEFDHEKNIATYNNLREESTKEVKFPKGTHDPLSAIYFYRTEDVDVGTKMDFYVSMNEKNYRVTGRVDKKAIVRVPEVGVYDAFQTSPTATLEGKPVEKGRATGYVSCSQDRTPLFGVVDVWVRLIGRVTLTLAELN